MTRGTRNSIASEAPLERVCGSRDHKFCMQKGTRFNPKHFHPTSWYDRPLPKIPESCFQPEYAVLELADQ